MTAFRTPEMEYPSKTADKQSVELSVVLPCLNEAETLETCIRKAQQTMREAGISGEVIVADNGSNWFFQGAPDPGWNDNDLNQLKSIPGTAFEVVDTGPVQTG